MACVLMPCAAVCRRVGRSGRRLSLRTRGQLMCQVIQAVAFMHASGVYHGECATAAAFCSLCCNAFSGHASGGIAGFGGMLPTGHRAPLAYERLGACSLKADNLLLGQTPDLNADLPPDLVKVADLGMCAQLDPSTGLVSGMTCRGTPSFMASELYSSSGAHATAATEVFALGSIMFELFLTRQPFREVDAPQLEDAILVCPPQVCMHCLPCAHAHASGARVRSGWLC